MFVSGRWMDESKNDNDKIKMRILSCSKISFQKQGQLKITIKNNCRKYLTLWSRLLDAPNVQEDNEMFKIHFK